MKYLLIFSFLILFLNVTSQQDVVTKDLYINGTTKYYGDSSVLIDNHNINHNWKDVKYMKSINWMYSSGFYDYLGSNEGIKFNTLFGVGSSPDTIQSIDTLIFRTPSGFSQFDHNVRIDTIRRSTYELVLDGIDSLKFNAGFYQFITNPRSSTSTDILVIDSDGYITKNPSAGGGSSEWTDLGTVLHPTEITDSVGIGTTAPSYIFDVEGNAGADNLYLSDSAIQLVDAHFIEKNDSLFIGYYVAGNGTRIVLDDNTESINLSKRIYQSDLGRSVIIGQDAGSNDDLTDNDNVYIGYDAGEDSETGAYNVAVGESAYENGVSGDYNSAIGSQALFTNTSGDLNTANGYAALLSNTVGSYNTAIGAGALQFNVTGNYNIAIGYGAGGGETGSNKLYIGDMVVGDFSEDTLALNADLNVYGVTYLSDSLFINQTNGDSLVDINGSVEIEEHLNVVGNARSGNEIDGTSADFDFNSTSGSVTMSGGFYIDSLSYVCDCETLADDGTIDLPDATAGRVEVWVNDGTTNEYILARVFSDGTVTIMLSNGDVEDSNSDNYLCLWDNGTAARISNRLDGQYKICYEFKTDK